MAPLAPTLRRPGGIVNRQIAGPPIPPRQLVANAIVGAAIQAASQPKAQQAGPPPPQFGPGNPTMLYGQSTPFSALPTQGPVMPPPVFGPGNPTQLYGQFRPNMATPPIMLADGVPLQTVPGPPGTNIGGPVYAATPESAATQANLSTTVDPRQRRRFETATRQLAQQQDARAAAKMEDAPTITALDQVTPDLIEYLSPDLAEFVMDYQKEMAANPDVEPLQFPPDYPMLVRINNELAERWGMSPEELARSKATQDFEDNPFGTTNLGPVPVPNIALSGLEDVMAVMDAPRRANVGRAGEDAYKVANGQEQSAIGQFLTWFPGKTDFEAWMRDPANAPVIKNAYENGYTASNGMQFSGGEAVWEVFIDGESRWKRGVYDLAYDPLTYAGAAAKPLEGAAAFAEGVGPTSKTGKALAGILTGAAKAASVPDVVLNQAADKAISGTLGAVKEGLLNVPLLGHLAKDAPATVGEDAMTRRMRALIFGDASQTLPEGMAPTTKMGGIPEPKPGPVTPALAAGELPPPGTPNPNVLTPSPFGEMEVRPDGTVLSNDPRSAIPFDSLGTPAERAPVSDLTARPAPEREVTVTPLRRGYSYVGEAREFRVAERGIGESKAFTVEPRQTSGRYGKAVGSFATYDEAVGEATSRIRGEPAIPRPAPSAQALPTPDVPEPRQADLTPPVAEGVTRPSPRLMTAAEREIGLREGTVAATDPFEGGTRLVDKAAQLGQQPEHAAAYERFLADGVPTPEQTAERTRIEGMPYDRATPAQKAEKRLYQVLDGAESVANTTGPAFRRNFPDEPIDIPVTEGRYRGDTSSGRITFTKENDRWLLQEYILNGRQEAGNELNRRYRGTVWIDDLLSRAEAARQKIEALRGPDGEPVGIVDERVRGMLGFDPQTAPRPMTQPSPRTEVPPDVQAVLDEPITHPDYADAGHTTGTLADALTTEARADQAEVERLVKNGVEPELPARGKPKGGVTASTMTVKVDGENVRQPVSTVRNPGQRLAELLLKWEPYGNIQTADPRTLAIHRIGQISREEANPKLLRRKPLLADLFESAVYRTPRSLLLADPVTSWGYTGRNIIGNTGLSSIGLKGQGINARHALNVREMVGVGKNVEQSVVGDLLADTFGEPARALGETIAGRSSSLDILERGASTPTRDLFGKLGLGKIAQAYDWKRGIDTTIERSMKLGGAFKPMFRAFLGEEIDPLARDVGTLAASRNIPIDAATVADAIWNVRTPAGGLSRHDVYDVLYRLATEAGTEDAVARNWADFGSRTWANKAKTAFERAVEQTNRIFPSRRMTNLDRYLSYAVLFHMWPTRAAKFVLEESIRDPRLPLWWYRAHEGLERLSEEEGTPSSARGWIKLGLSTLGYALYLDPAAAFMLTQLLPERPDYGDPEGETDLGHALKWIKGKTGLSPTPFIDAMINISGLYGDDFLPDPFPSRSKELAGAAIDVLMTQTGHGMGTPIYDQAMAKLRAWGSGALGISPQPYVDPAGKRSDPIASMVLQQNPDLAERFRNPETLADAEAELAAIMDDTNDDPRREKAERAVAGMGLYTQVFNAFSPFGIRSKNLTRESMIDTAKDAREIPYEMRTPQQQADVDARNFVTTTPEAMGPKAEQDQYGQLGTEREREIARNWNLLAFAGSEEFRRKYSSGYVTGISGERISVDQFVRMTEEERVAVADAYLDRNGYTEEYGSIRDAQAAFKDTHPAYKGYTEFAKTARDYPGGIKAFREQMMRASPAYRQYIGHLPQATRSNPAKLDDDSISMDAYLAARGTKASIYAPNLSQDNENWANTELLLNALGGSNGKTKAAYDLSTPEGKLASLKDKLATYDSDMAAYNASALGVTNGVPFETLAPQFATVATNQLAARGIKKPATPEIVAAYLLWKTYQQPGADTSPEAYIRFLTEYEQAATVPAA
jgi:hypothetical protein